MTGIITVMPIKLGEINERIIYFILLISSNTNPGYFMSKITWQIIQSKGIEALQPFIYC